MLSKKGTMGKIRVKTFDESGELTEDKKVKARHEAKKAEKVQAAVEDAVSEVVDESKSTKKSVKQAGPREDSKRHKSNEKLVDRSKTYSLKDALAMLKEFKKSKFDETVELHLNVTEKGISGQMTLPHGTGKTLRIKIADDETIDAVQNGKIDFDMLVAKPDMMPKLAKVARVLGPRGLMPNPKNGTITTNPEETIKKLSGGQVNYKTEAKDPIIHLSVGKVSFENEKLQENITTVFSSVGTNKINQAVLKSTMSPGIKVTVK